MLQKDNLNRIWRNFGGTSDYRIYTFGFYHEDVDFGSKRNVIYCKKITISKGRLATQYGL